MARKISPLCLLALVLATSATALAHVSHRRMQEAGAEGANSTATIVTVDSASQPAPIIWYKLHGWLMWGGFGVLMPAGILTARHMQTVTKAWFHIHLSCMFLGISCIVGGATIGFLKFRAIPYTPLTDHCAVHVYLGLAVFAMACLNFVLGLVRPHKGNLPRVFWYASHFTFGTCAVALAWYNILTGMDSFQERWNVDLSLERLIFGVQVSVLAFVYLFLGRWDYLVSQQDKAPRLDGITRLPAFRTKSAVVSHQEGDESLAMEEEHKIEAEREAAFA